jgi:hypothetical protein
MPVCQHITCVEAGDLRSRELCLSGRLPKHRSIRGDLHEVDYHAGTDEGLLVSCRDRFLSAPGYQLGIDRWQ